MIRENSVVAKFLISKGASISCQDTEGNSPLHLSVIHENLEIAKILVDNHADKFCKNLKGCIPIHLACQRGNIAITQLLLKNVRYQVNFIYKSLIQCEITVYRNKYSMRIWGNMFVVMT